MRRLHLAVGVGGIIAFLLTGQYMDRALGHMAGVPDLPRMLYRSAHIYLLLGSLLNLMAGVYLTEASGGWRRLVGRIGSVGILLAPALFVVAFISEPQRSDFHRPYAGPAIYACAVGAVLHAVSAARRRTREVAPQR
jgi:hypothetical protein